MSEQEPSIIERIRNSSAPLSVTSMEFAAELNRLREESNFSEAKSLFLTYRDWLITHNGYERFLNIPAGRSAYLHLDFCARFADSLNAFGDEDAAIIATMNPDLSMYGTTTRFFRRAINIRFGPPQPSFN